MADDSWGDKWQRALIGAAGGMMGEQYSQNRRDLLAEAELTRQDNLNKLKSENAYQNSSSGFVDAQGQPILRNRLSDHKGDKTSQYDWNKSATKEAAIAATANKYAAEQSPAGLAMKKEAQDAMAAKSAFERGKAERKAKRSSDAAIAMEAAKGENARLMQKLKEGTLSAKDKIGLYKAQYDEDKIINDESGGILSGKDKTEKQVLDDSRAKVDEMISYSKESDGKATSESSKDRGVRLSKGVNALLSGKEPEGDYTQEERTMIINKAKSLLPPEPEVPVLEGGKKALIGTSTDAEMVKETFSNLKKVWDKFEFLPKRIRDDMARQRGTLGKP